jgi:hypothetical protein
VTVELRRRGWTVNHKRVERLMRQHGIVGHRPRRRRSLTKQDQAAAPAPDLLGRLFDPDQVDVAWCGDVTYVPTDEGWPYLASVIDLASRHLLGYAMAPTTTPSWPATPWTPRWRPVVDGRWVARPSTPTAAASTPLAPASLPASGWGFAGRWAAPVRAWTTPSPRAGSPP